MSIGPEKVKLCLDTLEGYGLRPGQDGYRAIEVLRKFAQQVFEAPPPLTADDVRRILQWKRGHDLQEHHLGCSRDFAQEERDESLLARLQAIETGLTPPPGTIISRNVQKAQEAVAAASNPNPPRSAQMLSIPTREMCTLCHRPNPVGFHVPDEIWQRVVAAARIDSIHCLGCFIALADEKLVPWDREIQFFPVSVYTHLQGMHLLQEDE